jgi:hypothetical protein
MVVAAGQAGATEPAGAPGPEAGSAIPSCSGPCGGSTQVPSLQVRPPLQSSFLVHCALAEDACKNRAAERVVATTQNIRGLGAIIAVTSFQMVSTQMLSCNEAYTVCHFCQAAAFSPAISARVRRSIAPARGANLRGYCGRTLWTPACRARSAGRRDRRRGRHPARQQRFATQSTCSLVPPPKRHLTRYFGVLSSHATSRSEVVPAPTEPTPADEKGKPAGKSRYIPWSPPRPPPQEAEGGGDDWVN